MNTIWSEHVQGTMTLYLSRMLRFDDMFFEQYKDVFDLDRNAKLRILEIGCGPGALASSCCGMLSQKAFSFSVGSRHGAVQ